MHRSGTQSSFFIRTVNNSRQTTCQLPRQPFSIEPNKVEIANYAFDKISVVQLTLKNESRLPKKIKIVQPSKSYFSVKYTDKEIPGKDSLQIYLCFNPQKEKVVIEDELVIKGEGDPTVLYVPIICYPKHLMGRAQTKSRMSNLENEERSGRKGRRPSVRLKRMATKNSILLQPSTDSFQPEEPDTRYQEFQDKFRTISEYVREKYVKNEVYLGSKTLTRDKEHQIKAYRREVVSGEMTRLQLQVTGRYQTEYKSEGPIVTTLLECNITWNMIRNKPSLTFKKGMEKLQMEIKKYVTVLRFQKIQNSLRFYQDYKKKEEKQGRKFKIEDYVEYHNCRVNQNKIGLDYELEFDRSSIRPKHLPLEPEFQEYRGRFEGTERVDFDNWVPMNSINPATWEPYQEQEIPIPDFFLHHSTLLNDYREGASHEKHYKTGNLTLEAQVASYEPLSDEEGDGFECEFVSEMVEFGGKSYFCREEETQLSEGEGMQLGPLNTARWERRINTGMDWFGLSRTGEN